MRNYDKFAVKPEATETPLSPQNNLDPQIFAAVDPRHENPPDPNNPDSPLWDKLLSITFHAEHKDPASELPLSWALYELRFRGSVLKYTRFDGGTEGYKLYPVVGGAGQIPDGASWSNWPSQAEYAAQAKRLLSPHGELLRTVLAELKAEKPPDL